ncbi:MAG: ROK family protein [Chloroflexi bacterium]|nr:ROK family protein [Chloroflexota bacterium]
MSELWHIGVDLGASTFKCGLISPEWRIVARNEAPTRALEGPAQAAERVAQSVRALQAQLPAGATLAALGICSPGPIEHNTGVIVDPPNLTGWRNVPFAQMVREHLGIPVSLEHDAKAAALGEYHFGAGRGAKSMALIIVGTGIGAAFIVDGKLHRGEQDAAGEVGHFTVDMDGPICTCGSNGCVESYAGGPAIMNAYMYATRKKVESAEEIVRAAQNGDEIAQRVLQRAGRALGVCIATVAMTMDISTFVLFGSVIRAGDLLLEPARATVPKYSHKSISSRVRVMAGELGNDAGILGAAWGARSADG